MSALVQKLRRAFREATKSRASDMEADNETDRNLQRAGHAFLIAAIILGVFNSGALLHVVREAASEETQDLLTASEAWDGMMRQAGADRVTQTLRVALSDALALDWEMVGESLRWVTGLEREKPPADAGVARPREPRG